MVGEITRKVYLEKKEFKDFILTFREVGFIRTHVLTLYESYLILRIAKYKIMIKIEGNCASIYRKSNVKVMYGGERIFL